MKSQIYYLFLILGMIAVSYSIIAPLYPFIALSKNVSDSAIGIIFSSYAVSNILIIPLINNLISFFGRRKLCRIAIFICSISTIGFGLTAQINSYWSFIFSSFLVMFFEGAGIAILSIMLYSIAASNSDSHDIKTNLGYLELSYSLGLSLGPLVAGGIYYFLGERFPFYLCGTINLFLGNIFLHKLKIREEKIHSKTGFFILLFHWRVLFSFLVVMCDMMTTSFIFPVFSTHISMKFGLSVEVTSLFFAFEIIGYFVALQVLNVVNLRLGNKLTMVVGLMINMLGVLFLCPISPFPQVYWVVILGMTLLGFGGVFITVPGIIELMDSLRELGLNEQAQNDNASAMYNFSSALGEAFGPLLGGIVTDQGGFQNSCYVMSIFNFIFCLAFGVFNKRYIIKELGEAKKRKEKYEEDKASCHSWNYLEKSFASVGEKKVNFSYIKYAVSLNDSFLLPNDGQGGALHH